MPRSCTHPLLELPAAAPLSSTASPWAITGRIDTRASYPWRLSVERLSLCSSPCSNRGQVLPSEAPAGLLQELDHVGAPESPAHVKGPMIALDCFLEPAQVLQGIGQVVVRLGPVRIEPGRHGTTGCSLLIPLCLPECIAQIVVNHSRPWIKPYGRLVADERFRDPALFLEHISQVGMGVGII